MNFWWPYVTSFTESQIPHLGAWISILILIHNLWIYCYVNVSVQGTSRKLASEPNLRGRFRFLSSDSFFLVTIYPHNKRSQSFAESDLCRIYQTWPNPIYRSFMKLIVNHRKFFISDKNVRPCMILSSVSSSLKNVAVSYKLSRTISAKNTKSKRKTSKVCQMLIYRLKIPIFLWKSRQTVHWNKILFFSSL